MRHRVLTAAAAAALALLPAAARGMDGHAGGAPDEQVAIGFDRVTPPQVVVLAGNTVRFTNDSVRAHTVTADDGSFDSGRIITGEHFDRTVGGPGVIPYHCTLHPSIRGTVDVRAVLLDAPSTAASPGHAYPLHGRVAQAAGTTITVEGDHGDGFAPVATAAVDADGRFTATVTPTTTTTYRAVSGEQRSAPVVLRALDRRVRVTRTRRGGRDVITATVSPADPGGRVVLQLRIPERFGWWPVQRARLDRRSVARLVVRTRRRLPARVRLVLPDGATPLADSHTLLVGPMPH